MRILLGSTIFVCMLSIVPSASADASLFDKGAASKALSSVNLGHCKVPNGPKGPGHVKITFEGSGAVQSAVVDQGPYLQSPPVSKCIAGEYKKIKVPSFSGAPITVGKSFTIE
ncbi:MAG: hypothetical protein U0174_02390 [Polyangiaceae bacterium]